MNDEILSKIKETIVETIIEEPENPIVMETAIALGSIKPKLQSKTLEQLQAEARKEEEERLKQIAFDLKLQGKAHRCASGVAKGCVAKEVYTITRFNVPMCKACFEHWNKKYDDRP